MAAGGPGEDEYEIGRKAYHAKDYAKAEEHFGMAIAQGLRTAKVWLYAGHTFLALGQYERAVKTYEMLIRNFADSDEAKSAKPSLERAKAEAAKGPVAAKPPGAKPPVAGKPGAKPVAAAAEEKATNGLKDRIFVEPAKFSHPNVSATSIKAVREAVASLPPHLRKELDESGATIHIAPNLIDKWPESLNDLEKEENEEAPTLAEVPGRIYAKDMYMYERPKVRFSTNLGNPRPPSDLKHTVYNMCFQILDSIWNFTSDAKVKAQYEAEKEIVPDSYRDRLATYLKADEWGRKETCNDLAAQLLGQGDEKAEDLSRCFPKTKKMIKARLGV
jgi:tetratricopeptide (TPR) repeat protein